MLRINMWSSPRNLSTAMMYAWRERDDTTVFDEPFYAHYLRVTGREHPGRDDVLRSQNTDGSAVIEQVILADYATPVVFFKQMAKHLVSIDRSFLAATSNVLLTREPFDMLTSLQNQLPDATIADTGFVELVEILEYLEANQDQTKQTPIVIDSKILLLDPRTVLEALCNRLGIAFDPAMLSWPLGPKPEDGVWAPHWYDAVHRSNGWGQWRPKEVALLPRLEPVLEQARIMYERLTPYMITTN